MSNVFSKYRHKQLVKFRGSGGVTTNPNPDPETPPPTDTGYKPDPNYVRKGIIASLTFTSVNQTAYKNNWFDDNGGTQYFDAQKPFFAPGDTDPETGQTVAYQYHNTAKTRYQLNSDGSIKLDTSGKPVPNPHFKITGNTRGRVGQNCDLQTGTNGRFYVQSVMYEGLLHSTTNKRNASKLFTGRIFSIRKPTFSGGEFDPYQYRTTGNVVNDIIRAEIVNPSPGPFIESGKTYQNSFREFAYGVSIRLQGGFNPNTGVYSSKWITGSTDPETIYLTQWHDAPDTGRNPCIGWYIQGGNLRFSVKWSNIASNDTNTITNTALEGKIIFELSHNWGTNNTKITSGQQGKSNRTDKAVFVGTPQKPPYGQYLDLIVKVKWDHRPVPRDANEFGLPPFDANGNPINGYGTTWDGHLEVWLVYQPLLKKTVNGVTTYELGPAELWKWIDHYGPNCYNDTNMPYVKIGEYVRHMETGAVVSGVPAWSNEREMHVDEVRIARATTINGQKYVPGLEDVVPIARD